MLVSPISKMDKMVKRFVTKMNLQMFFVTGFWRVPTDIQTATGFILLLEQLLSNEPGEGSSQLIFGLWEYKDGQCSDIAS